MTLLVVNCLKTSLTNSLGVPAYLLQLTAALSEKHRLVFVLANADELSAKPVTEVVGKFASDILLDSEMRKQSAKWSNAIELLPHHFQPAEYCDKSLIICHDLHAFDIPWKYSDGMRNAFRRNVTAATVTMTYFPRTFYALERVAGVRIERMYYTESPLMFDPLARFDGLEGSIEEEARGDYLLYPAQLQLHKNHEILIRAAELLRRSGSQVTVLCPGTDFDEATTARLKKLRDGLGVESQVRFLGRVSEAELSALYRRAKGVIIPSLAEGGAYVAMEAIAAGKPVAVNRIESAEMHLSTIKAHVRWFDASSVEETARAMTELVSGAVVDENAAARERVRQLSWTGVAEKWTQVLGALERGAPLPVMTINQDASEIVYQQRG